MTAEEFANNISMLKPTKEEIIGLKYPEGLLRSWLAEFEIKPTGSNKIDADPIVSLIHNYDVSALVINDIKFDSTLEEDNVFLFIGWDANDRLAIYKPTGKVFAYDAFSGSIFNCAENPSSFLNALSEVMSFVKEKILNNYEEEQRDNRSAKVAYIAALKAGGEEYENYYKSVLWVE